MNYNKILWPLAWPQTPTQAQLGFLSLLDVREAAFLGDKVLGKTTALLMAALLFERMEAYRAVLFVKHHKTLVGPNGLWSRAKEWCHSRWGIIIDKGMKTIYLASGAQLCFGSLDRPSDRYVWKCAKLDFIGFDDLEEFDPDDYSCLVSRLRSNGDVPPRLRVTGNLHHIGPGAAFLKSHFIDNATDSRMGFFAPKPVWTMTVEGTVKSPRGDFF